MFTIDDANRYAVSDITATVLPCLYILLSEHDVVSKFNRHMPELEIQSSEDIISNIILILNHKFCQLLLQNERFVRLREQAIKLSETTLQLTQEIISAIRDAEPDFMHQFKLLLNGSNDYTMNTVGHLIEQLNCEDDYLEYDNINTYQDHTYCEETYAENDNSNNGCNCMGRSCEPCKVKSNCMPNNCLPSMLHETGSLFWQFSVKIQRSLSCCRSNRHDKELEIPLQQSQANAQSNVRTQDLSLI